MERELKCKYINITTFLLKSDVNYTGALEPWNHLGTMLAWQAMGGNNSPAKKNNWKQSVFYQPEKIA